MNWLRKEQEQQKRKRNAFTLFEVAVALFVASIAVLLVNSGLGSLKLQQHGQIENDRQAWDHLCEVIVSDNLQFKYAGKYGTKLTLYSCREKAKYRLEPYPEKHQLRLVKNKGKKGDQFGGYMPLLYHADRFRSQYSNNKLYIRAYINDRKYSQSLVMEEYEK